MSARHSEFHWKSVFYIIAGILVSSISQAYFLIPNKIVPGGLVGLGTLLYHHAAVPIGLFIIAGNSVLIIVQARSMGLASSGKTIAAILLQGVLLDMLTTVWKVEPLARNPNLACIYGGLLSGIGGALVFRGGGSLGGTDIIGQLLFKFKHIPMGKTLLWSDVLVLGTAAAVYGPDLALYALIKSYISSEALDKFMEGFSDSRQVMIISKQAETLAWGIMEELHRGVTLLAGRGAYTNRPSEVILTAIRRRELPVLEELVYRIDPAAFMIVSDARRIIGRGFDDLEKLVERAKEAIGETLPEPERTVKA